MGIPFFVLFVLSIAFLSLGITGWGGFISVEWPQQDSVDAKSDTGAVTPYLSFQPNYWAIAQCFTGFLLFLASLYFMGFFLYLEERESGRIMKNVKSFAKLRQFLERHQKGDLSQ
jgi:hypothetical protein